MSRPQKCRFIQNLPEESFFNPTVDDLDIIEQVIISFDELEALRLADLEGLSQAESAEIMGISRSTFGRIIEKARKNSADALINKKKIFIMGGKFCNKHDKKSNCNRKGECMSCCKNFNSPN